MKRPNRWWIPDVVDLHVYGGAAVMAAGLALWNVWLGPAVFGAVLLGLGLVRY